MTTNHFPSPRRRRALGALVGAWASIFMTLAEPSLAQEPKLKDLRVLFIGNSQIYYNDLPRMVEALAESAPSGRPRIRADRFVKGGASLESLWKAGTAPGSARAKIQDSKWDYVVVQEIYYVKREAFDMYAPLFHELIHQQGARTVLLCTASISQRYPNGFQELHDMHIAMGKKLKVPVAAAGKSWLAYWGEQPTPEERLALYAPDKAHPGKKGSYIYACNLYAVLTGQAPLGLTHRLPQEAADTITEAEARRFQEAAWKVHQEVNK